MRPCGTGSRIARNAYLLPGIHRVAYLDGYGTQVQVADLYLGSAFTRVLDGDGFSSGSIGIVIHRHHLAVLFRGQHCLVVTAYVHTLVHLLF